MRKTVYVYEDNGGMIHAIVKDGNAIDNIITGFEDGLLHGSEFVEAARGGFEYADSYDPDNFSGLTINEAAEEIEGMDELIAEISADSIELHTEKMGFAGKALFDITEEA